VTATDSRRPASGVRRPEDENQTPNAKRQTPNPSGIGAAFAAKKAAGDTALVPFITAGYPDMETSEHTLLGLIEGGAAVIEVGVPFSDPLADGPTVQRTSQAALAAGTRLVDCIDLVRKMREVHGVTTPLILFGYYNPFFQMGIEECVAACASAGVDGFIIPDLPAEESADFAAACRAHGRDLIFLVAPTSTDARLQDMAEKASGFVYCISVTGTTGARDQISDELPAYIARVRAATDLPLAIGFGISTPEHVRFYSNLVEGAVIGSALINHLDRFEPAERRAAAADYLRYLRGEVDLPEQGAS
jgi:tryptophan synthase alpha chain